jgi:hypothetical protein
MFRYTLLARAFQIEQLNLKINKLLIYTDELTGGRSDVFDPLGKAEKESEAEKIELLIRDGFLFILYATVFIKLYGVLFS